MPAYPWFRPAIREFERNPEQLIREHTGYSSFDEIPNADAMVKAAATALSNQMQNNVNAQKSVNRSPGTDAEHPKRDTGNLTADISAVRIK